MHRARRAMAGPVLLALVAGGPVGCSAAAQQTGPSGTAVGPATAEPTAFPAPGPALTREPMAPVEAATARPSSTNRKKPRTYPWHRRIVSTTFWVGEIFDPNVDDGSQVISTYDSAWLRHYGGCDGIVKGSGCETERRTAANGWFPTRMTPKQNPFYLDLPFDDVNDPIGAATRLSVIPWAKDSKYRALRSDADQSLMKNRWVELHKDGHVCFGQIEDAGPGQYHDARYVFGSKDARPRNARYGGAGMDVSPALNGCLHFAELDGDGDRVTWRFVEDSAVPRGPWRTIVTATPLS